MFSNLDGTTLFRPKDKLYKHHPLSHFFSFYYKVIFVQVNCRSCWKSINYIRVVIYNHNYRKHKQKLEIKFNLCFHINVFPDLLNLERVKLTQDKTINGFLLYRTFITITDLILRIDYFCDVVTYNLWQTSLSSY